MRGSIKKRYEGSYSLIIDMGYQPDRTSGKLKRKQKWVTFRGTKEDADKKLTELLNAYNKGTFVEPNKVTIAAWLGDWLEKIIRPTRAPRTYDTYKHIIDHHLVPNLGAIRLQELKPIHLDHYYGEHRGTLAETTLSLHHMIIHGALQAAIRNDLVVRNVAKLVNAKPTSTQREAEDIEPNCWTGDEACRFLDAAKVAGDQHAAFYSLALETGMRKSELGGLQWKDVDLAKGAIRLHQQIVIRPKHPWTWGPLKGKRPHTINITTETAQLLRRHKAHQAEVKLQSGGRYHDHGLVFAKEWPDVVSNRTALGDPLNVGRGLARIAKSAGVRRITIHGMRHTSATLSLNAGRPVAAVSKRLGHAKTSITLDVYGHVLPGQDQETADVLGAVLHGKR